MKLIASLINVAVLILFIILLIKDTPKIKGWEDVLLPFVLVCYPLINLIAIWKGNDKNWISLYLKRKALEEQDRINRLNK